jgi:thiol:disulfide interchange protein
VPVMSRHLTASQNKIRLIAVFLFTVFLAITFYLYKDKFQPGSPIAASNAETVDESLFIGLRHATPAEIKAALPEAIGKPTLLDFKSKLCHDCKRLAPALSQALSRHPNIYVTQVDVLDDRQKYPAILRAFKPVSVPTLVLISPRGEVQNVLYNYQKPEVIDAALTRLERQSRPSPTTHKK